MICIAATNFPQSLDKALTRPGRFDRHVTVPNPDVKGRKEILEVHFKNVPAAKDVDLKVRGSHLLWSKGHKSVAASQCMAHTMESPLWAVSST